MTREEHETRKERDPAYAKAMKEVRSFLDEVVREFELTSSAI